MGRFGRVLIGGVGYRWMRDASFGLVVVDALAERPLPPHVDVMDLGYGAIYASQDIAAAAPPYERVVLVAGVPRGRPPGTLVAGRWRPEPSPPAQLQERMREAGAGVIDLEHLLHIGAWFGAWPDDVVLVEFEPVEAEAGDGLSDRGAAALEEGAQLALAEALSPRAVAP